MSKHTSGPWFVSNPSRIRFEIRTADKGKGLDVAVVKVAKSAEQTEANARLISAAPELLASLRAIVSHPDLNYPLPSRTLELLIEEAILVISKAEGHE